MNRKCAILLLSMFVLFGFGVGEAASDELGNARIQGTIYGTKVKLTSAKFDGGQLELYAGDGWAFNPSVLMFLFDHKKDVVPGKTIRISNKKKFSNPHLHCRFVDPKTKKIDCEMAMNEYQMVIKFGQPIKGYLPGEIKLKVPGPRPTELQGKFFLKMASKK